MQESIENNSNAEESEKRRGKQLSVNILIYFWNIGDLIIIIINGLFPK